MLRPSTHRDGLTRRRSKNPRCPSPDSDMTDNPVSSSCQVRHRTGGWGHPEGSDLWPCQNPGLLSVEGAVKAKASVSQLASEGLIIEDHSAEMVGPRLIPTRY